MATAMTGSRAKRPMTRRAGYNPSGAAHYSIIVQMAEQRGPPGMRRVANATARSRVPRALPSPRAGVSSIRSNSASSPGERTSAARAFSFHSRYAADSPNKHAARQRGP